MKNDLTCGVVRDLLPSYAENLLGEDSREAVERHLKTCPACTAQMEAMASPSEEAKAAEAAESAKEVDYLKRVKKGTLKKVALAVICTAAVLLGCVALKLFVIGTPLQPQSVAVVLEEVQDEGKTLFLSLSSVGSGNAFHSWKVETVDGVASIYARDVLVSPLYSTGNAQVYVPLEGVREVWLGGVSGKLLWQDGMVITQECLDLLSARTPYCGDAAALGRIANILQIGNLGPYTTELQTSKEPYRWTLNFSEQISDPEKSLMIRNEYLMLALVDNLEEVWYTLPPAVHVPGDTSRGGGLITKQADPGIKVLTDEYNVANGTAWEAKERVKDYTQSPADFQEFLDILNWHFREYGR